MYVALQKNVNSVKVFIPIAAIEFSCFCDIASLFGFRVFRAVRIADGSTSRDNVSMPLNVNFFHFFGFFFSLLFCLFVAILTLFIVISYTMVSFLCLYLFAELVSSPINVCPASTVSVNNLFFDSVFFRAVAFASQACLV